MPMANLLGPGILLLGATVNNRPVLIAKLGFIQAGNLEAHTRKGPAGHNTGRA